MRGEATLWAWPLRRAFRVAGHVIREAEVVVVRLYRGGLSGEGEGVPIWYKGERPQDMRDLAQRTIDDLPEDASRFDLLEALPASSARAALDAALWGLEAAERGVSVRRLMGLGAAPAPQSTFTIGIGTPEEMARAASAWGPVAWLKVKLGGGGDDAARLRAVRAARPDARLVVDANAAWTLAEMARLEGLLVDLGVELLEQPLAPGDDGLLRDARYAIPLAADESLQDREDLDRMVGRYQVANIKLDKCGGLTRALQLKQDAVARGLEPMIGNMGGTALSLGPHILAAAGCPWADLDGPAFLQRDRDPPLIYERGTVRASDPVWA